MEVMERADEVMDRYEGSYRQAIIDTARDMGAPQEIAENIADLATDSALDMEVINTLYENREHIERLDDNT